MSTNNTTDSDKTCNEDLQNCENKATISDWKYIVVIVVVSIFVLIAFIILIICWMKKREKSKLSVFQTKTLENQISPESKKASEDEENSPKIGSKNVLKLEIPCPQSEIPKKSELDTIRDKIAVVKNEIHQIQRRNGNMKKYLHKNENVSISVPLSNGSSQFIVQWI